MLVELGEKGLEHLVVERRIFGRAHSIRRRQALMRFRRVLMKMYQEFVHLYDVSALNLSVDYFSVSRCCLLCQGPASEDEAIGGRALGVWVYEQQDVQIKRLDFVFDAKVTFV